jgi:hypothetical protein
MIVPLDLIYHYLDDIVDRDFVIYHQYPFGSKNIENQRGLYNYTIDQSASRPVISFWDQEPMHSAESIDAARSNAIDLLVNYAAQLLGHDAAFHPDVLDYFRRSPLGRITNLFSPFDYDIIVGSQKTWLEPEYLAKEHFVYVYYWFHALAARDWYRYSQCDPRLDRMPDAFEKDFLIYNRAWSGTREYRLTLVQSLLDRSLTDLCQVGFQPWDDQRWYLNHQFHNPDLAISRNDLHTLLAPNTASPDSSACYSWKDYHRCAVDLVCETVFDTEDIFLTEKILRPIACGKPFLLLAPPGSLEYLRSYGFKTFAPYIDESYDLITESSVRLGQVVNEIERIAGLPTSEKIRLWQQLHEIAGHNRERFWSRDFFDQVVGEFHRNIAHALDTIGSRSHHWKPGLIQLLIRHHPELQDRLQKLHWLIS